MFKGSKTEKSDVSQLNFDLARIHHSLTLVLQNKWRHLEKTLKKDEKLKSMHDDLKDNINNIDYELKEIKTSIKETDSKTNLSIKKVNRFLKDMKIKLSRMKPKLFELNLTVHSLIGEVCEDDVELRHLEADRVKEDLVEVYEFWDEVSLMVSERLAHLEDTESKLRTVEAGLEEVTKFLTQETGDLVERMTTTDSGISDASDMRLDRKIQEQEDCILKMKKTVTVIKKTHSSSSFYMSNIIKALSLSSTQLNQLKSITSASKPGTNKSVLKTRKTGSHQHKRHIKWYKLLKYWRLLTFFLLFALCVSVLTMPHCCEHSNSLYLLLPSITYTSGMRPM